MLDAVILLIVLIIFVPFVMPGWRSLLTLCLACLLVELGVRVGTARFSAADVPGILVQVGNSWIEILRYVILIHLCARATVLTLRSLGMSGRLLFLAKVLSILSLPIFMVGAYLLERFDRRPAPTRCTAQPIALRLAGIEGKMPWRDDTRLFIGSDIWNDRRNLRLNRDRRSLCWTTSNGKDRLEVTVIAVDFDRDWTARCAKADLFPWEEKQCAAQKAGPLNFPVHEVLFFDSGGIEIGNFSLPQASTDENHPVRQDEQMVSAQSPDLGKVTALCKAQPDRSGGKYCQMRRTYAGGFQVAWEAHVSKDAVDAGLLGAEALAKDLCTEVFGAQYCAFSQPTVPASKPWSLAPTARQD